MNYNEPTQVKEWMKIMSVEKLLQEKKKQLEEWRKICLEYPKSENYEKTYMKLQQEIADLAESLYK